MNLSDGAPGLGWGGGTVLIVKLKMTLLGLGGIVDWKAAAETVIMAAIGATVGFFVHLFWKTITKKT